MMESLRESLKTSCLSVIVDNFDRFFGAFQSSEGSVLSKHFEFLERAFSETLLHDLSLSGKLKASYFNLLINRHVKNLNLEMVDDELIPKLVSQLEIIESNIITIEASLWNVDLDLCRRLLSCLPKVEVIKLLDTVYCEVFEDIGKKCPVLKVLKVVGDITDASIMNIFLNDKGEFEDKICLQELNVSDTLITDEGISFVLSHAPSLKSVGYKNTPRVLYDKHNSDLENNCLNEVKKYCLSSLSFPFYLDNVLDTLKICTVLCPDTSSLHIDCLKDDQQLLLLAKFPRLRELAIFVENKSFSFDAVTQFLKLRGNGLFYLKIEQGCISAQSLAEYCPKLHNLKLLNAQYQPLDSNKCLFSKMKFNCLKSLSIECDFAIKDVADSVKLIVSNAKGLEKVRFSRCTGLTEPFFECLIPLGLFQVQDLDLSSSDITLPSLIKLLSHHNLKVVNLENCINVSPADYFQLLEVAPDVSIVWHESGSDESYDADFEQIYDDDFLDYDGYEFDDDYEGENYLADDWTDVDPNENDYEDWT